MTDSTLWTLDELVRLAGQALSVDYDGAPSGRIRDVPDRRLVRWYVTRGLVDRPAASHGRNALYSRRHLLQLVAIKRLQAQGHSLAEIQARLAGATEHTLEQLARLNVTAPLVPDRPATTNARSTTPGRTRFWVDRPTTLPTAPPLTPPLTPPPPVAAVDSLTDVARSAAHAMTAARPLPPAPTTWTLRAIELSPGITLLIDPAATNDVGPDDVRHAARALLDLLVPDTVPHENEERSTP